MEERKGPILGDGEVVIDDDGSGGNDPTGAASHEKALSVRPTNVDVSLLANEALHQQFIPRAQVSDFVIHRNGTPIPVEGVTSFRIGTSEGDHIEGIADQNFLLRAKRVMVEVGGKSCKGGFTMPDSGFINSIHAAPHPHTITGKAEDKLSVRFKVKN